MDIFACMSISMPYMSRTQRGQNRISDSLEATILTTIPSVLPLDSQGAELHMAVSYYVGIWN